MNQVTPGTLVAIIANCAVAVVGVLQGVDWVHVVGGQTAGIVVALLAGINVLAHYYTGNPPAVSK